MVSTASSQKSVAGKKLDGSGLLNCYSLPVRIMERLRQEAEQMSGRRWISWIAQMCACLSLLLGAWGGSVAAQQGLRIGGNTSHFGRQTLRGQFMPDPFTVRMVSGGGINVSTLGLAPGCVGFVSREPDFILNLEMPANFLRIFFQGEGDTTLVINDAAGRWHCNDDSYGTFDPTIDFAHPPAGHYDIWVGSYSSDNVRGVLHVTELRSRHP